MGMPSASQTSANSRFCRLLRPVATQIRRALAMPRSSPLTSVTWALSRRIRRRLGHPGLAAGGWPGNPGRPDAGTRPGTARHRLAYRPRHHRRSGLFLRHADRHAGQVLHRREADDADRGRRSVRALRARAAPCRKSATRSRRAISTPASAWCASTWPRGSTNMADHVRPTGPWDIEWIVLPQNVLPERRRAGPVPLCARVTRSRSAPHARQTRTDTRNSGLFFISGGEDGNRIGRAALHCQTSAATAIWRAWSSELSLVGLVENR